MAPGLNGEMIQLHPWQPCELAICTMSADSTQTSAVKIDWLCSSIKENLVKNIPDYDFFKVLRDQLVRSSATAA